MSKKPFYLSNFPEVLREPIRREAARQGRSFTAQVQIELARAARRIINQEISRKAESRNDGHEFKKSY